MIDLKNNAQLFDEMWGHDSTLRDAYANFNNWLEIEEPARLRKKQTEAERLFRLSGITFNVYSKDDKEKETERLIPFDIIPRIISAREWSRLSTGIEQRVRAINAFLHDIYLGKKSFGRVDFPLNCLHITRPSCRR